MAQYRKILLSGSNAHVAQVTASNVPAADTNDTVLFLSNTDGEVRTNSNLSLSDSTTLEFNGGTFSGSFSGDGTNITNVTADLANSLDDGPGIAPFSYDGSSSGIKVELDLNPKGGLTFYDVNSDVGPDESTAADTAALGLTSSLAGNGLQFDNIGSDDYSIMSIELPTYSGLSVGASGLSVASNIGGTGIAFANGILSIDTASNSGLTLSGGQLAIDSTIAGTGLTFTDGVLDINSSVVVDSGNTIGFTTASNNIVITLTNSDTSVTDITDGKSSALIKNPILGINISDTLDGNFTFNDNVTIKGDLTVESSATEVNFDVQNLNIADQFILVNSGSTSGDGGIVVQQNASSGLGAFLFYESANNRWAVSDETKDVGDETHTYDGAGYASIVTVQLVTDAESTILLSTPPFGTDAASQSGQLKIKTNQTANESGVFIYS